jgi:hypothetical protein
VPVREPLARVVGVQDPRQVLPGADGYSIFACIAGTDLERVAGDVHWGHLVFVFPSAVGSGTSAGQGRLTTDSRLATVKGLTFRIAIGRKDFLGRPGPATEPGDTTE